MPVYSIGHSNVPEEKFLDLLKLHGIDVLIDVRSAPYSRYNPQFGREALRQSVMAEGIRYLFLGNLIGGKPPDQKFRLPDGSVDYDLLLDSAEFRKGLDQVVELGENSNVAVMCAEADFRHCHRYRLITKGLLDRGVDVSHILHSGGVAATDPEDFSPRQGSLF